MPNNSLDISRASDLVIALSVLSRVDGSGRGYVISAVRLFRVIIERNVYLNLESFVEKVHHCDKIPELRQQNDYHTTNRN
jgi:hypothetical protein